MMTISPLPSGLMQQGALWDKLYMTPPLALGKGTASPANITRWVLYSFPPKQRGRKEEVRWRNIEIEKKKRRGGGGDKKKQCLLSYQNKIRR
jgi:hypothetical protein